MILILSFILNSFEYDYLPVYNIINRYSVKTINRVLVKKKNNKVPEVQFKYN